MVVQGMIYLLKGIELSREEETGGQKRVVYIGAEKLLWQSDDVCSHLANPKGGKSICPCRKFILWQGKTEQRLDMRCV